MDHRKVTGKRGEKEAALYLESQGVSITETNYRSRYGEIDLIGRDGRYLIAVEVKARGSYVSGQPAEAVDYRKITKICRTFNRYRMVHHIPETMPVRFDVVEVDTGGTGTCRCRWIKNAFEYVE